MSLEIKINEDLKTAMKNKDEAAKRAIRLIKAQILLANTDASGKPLDAEGEIKLLQKMVKQRKESLDIFEKQNREDLAIVEREEIAVIERYLPKQMDEASLTSFLKDLVAKTGASTIKDMGKVVGLANQQLAGQAEGKVIAEIIKKLLS